MDEVGADRVALDIAKGGPVMALAKRGREVAALKEVAGSMVFLIEGLGPPGMQAGKETS